MQTRGVLGFRASNIDKITYVNDNANPYRLGERVVKWIRGIDSWRDVKKRVLVMKKVDNLDFSSSQDTEKIETCLRLDIDLPDQPSWYNILRSTQGDPERILLAKYYIPYKNFFLTSRHCMHGYIINLDTEKFEVYQGGTRKKHDLGRYSLKKFFGPALVGKFDLDSIPENWRELCLRLK